MAISQREEEAELIPSAHPEGREGFGGLWVGMVLVKVGQVPALCSAREVGGKRVSGLGRGLCSSTSSIPCLPNSRPTLYAGE